MPKLSRCSRHRLVHAAIAALAFGVLAVVPATGRAATITVTTTTDPATPACPSVSNCSLRGAIAAAVDGDTISLGAATYAVTQGTIIINTGVTIVGAGMSATTIDASGSVGSHRVLKVRGVVDHHVILRYLSITGGAYTASGFREGGAGIANNTQQPLFLNNVRVYGNTATVDGPLYVGGAGIRSEASVYLANSQVDHNTLVVTGSQQMSGGGGVYVADASGHGDLVMTHSIISDNSATIAGDTPDTSCDVSIPYGTCPSNHGGGGAYIAGEDLVMTDSSIINNTLTVTNAYAESGGGGAFVQAGDFSASGSVISGNTASVTNTTDEFRPASNEGGGALYLNGHDATIAHSTLAGNALTVVGQQTADNYYSDTQNGTNGGGAIYQYGNRLVINASTVSGNSAAVPSSARSGGGGLYDNGNADAITNSTFAGNTTSVGPHTVFNALPIRGVTASVANGTETNGGGAIFLVGVGAGVILSNVTIAGNSAPNAVAGGLMSYSNASKTWPVVEDSIIAANTSSGSDSANCFTSGDATIFSLGYNLADDAANSCGFTATGDQIAAPHLGPLQANGGPTQTMALPASSPAVNGGDPAGCGSVLGPLVTVDQRGVSRVLPAGSRCDIGAYERANPRPITIASQSSTATTITTRVRVTGPGTITQTARRGTTKACTAHATATTATTITLTCHLNAATRSATASQSQKLRVLTTFTSVAHGVARVASVVRTPQNGGPTTPVTG